jgi:choline monooxygenase
MNVHTQLDPVLTSVNKAKGLPNEHYVNDEIFNEEKRSVLFKNWSGIGVVKDIPEMGDAKPIDFLGMPLLIVRDRDGNVGVFQNTCRHRGMILVKEPGKIRGAIRCPYHSWCYDLNGALRATPHVGGPGHNKHEDIKNEDLGLFRIRSHVWQDVIFVNISGDADEFQKVHSDLLQRWREFDQPIYHGGKHSSFKLEVKTNWKLAVENYCESYHLPWIHPGLNSYSKLEDHYNIEVPLQYSGLGTLVYRQLKSEDGAVFPDFIDLSKQWNEGAEYIAVYPNVLMGFHRDHFFSILLEPVNTNHTIEHVDIYYPNEASASPEYEELRTANAEQWKTVFEEDIFVVEGMQKGRNGVLFDGGKFSPAMDGPTHNFHYWVATQIAEGRTQESS